MSHVNPDPPSWAIFGPPVRGRKCGGCTACCVQLPVRSINKLANQRCAALCSRGCRVYATRPIDCRTFSCRWLMDQSTSGLRRPDRSGYVIDPMLDTVVVNGRPIDVVQIWVDPKRTEAHRDPALRAWLVGIAERFGLPALVRWDSEDAMFLAAPCLTSTGEWGEQRSGLCSSEKVEAAKRAATR